MAPSQVARSVRTHAGKLMTYALKGDLKITALKRAVIFMNWEIKPCMLARRRQP